MATLALIIAGGVGARMHQAIPKQFITVYDKPIIAYTLEKFERHPAIDAIAVVCLKGWETLMASYAAQFKISKLKYIVPGGNVGQESIKNGLVELAKHYEPDDIVLIHDAIRPNISADIISDCISTIRCHGSAVVVIPCAEAMMVTENAKNSSKTFPRNNLKRTQTPQGAALGKLLAIHEKAAKLGISDSVATCTLMAEVGETIFFSTGSEKNIKITTPEDIDIFKALLKMGE